MIQQLKHTDPLIAEQILSISLEAYQIEADTIGVTDFPPLAEKVADITNSGNLFYGYTKNDQLIAVQEIERKDNGWLIARLAVSPRFFRQGIASALVAYAIANYQPCTVSTAINNLPAITLYEKHGFIQSPITRQITADITIMMLTYCGKK